MPGRPHGVEGASGTGEVVSAARCKTGLPSLSGLIVAKPPGLRSGPRPCLQGAACVDADLLSGDVACGV